MKVSNTWLDFRNNSIRASYQCTFVDIKPMMYIMYTLVQALMTLSLLEVGLAEFNPVWSYDFTQSQIEAANSLVRDEFPENFYFGVSMSGYQNEGAWNVSDKGLSVWDYALNNNKAFIMDGRNGNVAADFYHKYKEDIQLAKSVGTKMFRTSINWPRLLPNGMTNHISEDGVNFYNNLINELLANGITPMITLFHGEMPYTIHRLGSYLNPLIIDLSTYYARVAFTLFGDRVKYWLSINEFDGMCLQQNALPDPLGYNLSGIMEYECYRNSLLAHASIYHMYKREFAASQKGKVGFTLDALWYVSDTDTENVTLAIHNAQQWISSLSLNPILTKKGDFPSVVTDRVNFLSYLEGYPKSRVPPFTDTEIRLIKGTTDFVGLNYYHTQSVRPIYQSEVLQQSQYQNDMGVKNVFDDLRDDFRLLSTPWALRKLLSYLKEHYDMPDMYITEVGYVKDNEIRDSRRALYYYDHLKTVLSLLKDGFDIKGLLVWSLTDNLSWQYGYDSKVGLFHVDFDNLTLPRTPKLSSKIVRSIFQERRIKPMTEILIEKEDIIAMTEFISSLNSY